MKTKCRNAALLVLAVLMALSVALAGCSEQEPEPELIGIEVTTPPRKVAYVEGESFDKTGMVVKAVYSDDTHTPVTDYTVSPAGALALGVTSVTVTYQTFTDTVPITVSKPSLTAQLTGSYERYKFEAETGELVTDIGSCAKGLEGTVESNNHPSGDAFIHHLSQGGTAAITYHITAEADAQAVLTICLGLGTARSYKNLFEIKINGVVNEPVENFDVPAWDTVEGAIQYYTWTEFEVMIVSLKEGDNEIVFTKTTNGLNFDYFVLTSTAPLENTAEKTNGHSYQTWTLEEEPTLESTGKAVSYCEYCRDRREETLPEISEANGYTKKPVEANGPDTFGKATWEYTLEGYTFEFSSRLYPTNGTQSYLFECERMTLEGAASIGKEANSHDPHGGAYVQGLSGNTGSVTLEITSDKAAQALFIICFGCRNTGDVKLKDKRTLTVNGSEVTIPDDVVFTRANTDYNYFNWAEFEVMILDLQAGKNTIKLTNNGGGFSNLDYFRLVSSAELELWFEE